MNVAAQQIPAPHHCQVRAWNGAVHGFAGGRQLFESFHEKEEEVARLQELLEQLRNVTGANDENIMPGDDVG